MVIETTAIINQEKNIFLLIVNFILISYRTYALTDVVEYAH